MDNERLSVLEAAVNMPEHSKSKLELLEKVLDSFDNCVVVTDPLQDDNPIIYVNRTFERITGYSFDEALGRNCRFLQGEEQDQAGLEPLKNGLAERDVTRTLLRNYRKNGELFWNELYVTPVRDDNGKLVYFVGVQNDVTKRETLAAERALLDAAIANAADSVVITDAGEDIDHKIVLVNPAFTKLTGYNSDEVKGKNPRFLQGEKTSPAVIDRLRKALYEGSSFRGETVNYRKDGSDFIMEWNVTPLRLGGANARIDNWVATQRDVSERRLLEKRVLEATDKETRRIGRELHDGVVQEMSVALMLANTTLSTLSDTDEASKDMLKQTIEQIKLSIEEARTLSHQLHGLNLMGSGLMRAFTSLTHTLEASDVEIQFWFENPLVMKDAERAEHIYRVAREAVGNALKHSNATDIQIGLSNHGPNYTLSVRDNGNGFGEVSKEGMGLQNMRYRAAQLGGELSISSDPNGTLLTLTFEENLNSED